MTKAFRFQIFPLITGASGKLYRKTGTTLYNWNRDYHRSEAKDSNGWSRGLCCRALFPTFSLGIVCIPGMNYMSVKTPPLVVLRTHNLDSCRQNLKGTGSECFPWRSSHYNKARHKLQR